ncbi:MULTISPECIES: DUF2513 domain-containing protein [unclassified Sphingomonas]|uniref:DUF2513 domain-containing protein n=1 Tax=unclassified Sphingomonas TaxID=196159 RepID=UPI0006F49DED|nr:MULTISPECIES: DUF2513 domain-containing protein [unclassified Sphingomonas]KQX19050.1 hypothetical protein ASD17_10785 [Sphingomonas sp. Root1294]KQY65251.1 hypothetical protein ASD39_13980 [Sphingomonas sp. Root50]KRB95455.1 hypothetical protein ASE22_06075 [Sphingomonas sp. Root720]
MRRDSDLIRAILLAVEADDRCEVLRLPDIAGYTDEAVHFHARLLVEKGFLVTYFPDRTGRQPWVCIRLSWEGYDFLDAIRDPAIWRSVKRAAGKVGSWSIETLAAIAKTMIIAKVEALGLAA